jgi:hypothetical protein
MFINEEFVVDGVDRDILKTGRAPLDSLRKNA